MKALVPLSGHNKEVFVQTLAGLKEALDEPDPIVPRLHVIRLLLQALKVIAPVHIMMG